MAVSPSHKFGQVIGDLLEEIMAPYLQAFCDERGLFLDKKGIRGAARPGKKVSWEDKFGNIHDLDFVIEKGGTADVRGKPLAFIEAAWRRYTKHSRNKAQEIQGAILPIAEKYMWDKPFLGAVLAGVFTDGSLAQMKSSGFEVVLFPYKSIVTAFKSVGVEAEFDESTSDADFEKSIQKIEALSEKERTTLKSSLVEENQVLLRAFISELEKALDRSVDYVLVIPLHGRENKFSTIEEALNFISEYAQVAEQEDFKKYEAIVKYTNGDKIDASFADKSAAISFLKYVDSSG